MQSIELRSRGTASASVPDLPDSIVVHVLQDGEWLDAQNSSVGGLLKILTCNCWAAKTSSPMQIRFADNTDWTNLTGPIAQGSELFTRVPLDAKAVHLRALGDDGWCVRKMVLADNSSAISGVPMWLDRPCEPFVYYCHLHGSSFLDMPCSSSRIFPIVRLPKGVTQSAQGTGCANRELLLLGPPTHENLTECTDRCLLTPFCRGFQFRAGDGRRSEASCNLWGSGECIEYNDGSWDQYRVRADLVRPSPRPFAGSYLSYSPAASAPQKTTCMATERSHPIRSFFCNTSGMANSLYLKGRDIIGYYPSGRSGPSGRLLLNGVIDWSGGMRSIPIALVAEQEAGTIDGIQFRLSVKDEWAYAAMIFERGHWSGFRVGPSTDIQLRAVGADAWCVDGIRIGRLQALSGLPMWLQRGPLRSGSGAGPFAAPGNVWHLEESLPGFSRKTDNGSSCLNWRDITLGVESVEVSVGACAKRCEGAASCMGFQFMPFASCGSWHERGTCGLLSGHCMPYDGNLCWDQYEMVEQASAFASLARNRRWWLWVLVGVLVAMLAVALGSWRSLRKAGSCCALSCGRAAGLRVQTRATLCLDEKLRSPAWAAISLKQLEDLYSLAVSGFGGDISSATMYDVNARILQPICAQHGKCYAHVVNGEDPLFVDVFVSHAWQERFDEFVADVRAPFSHWTQKPNLWICATALFQSTDPEVVAMQVGVGDDPREAPFTRALQEADKMLVVRNSSCDLYDRIWCCWELYLAQEIGLVHRPGSMMVTGPQHSDARSSQGPPLAVSTSPVSRRSEGPLSRRRVDIASAASSSPADREKILAYIGGPELNFEGVNRQLEEIRSFGF